MSINQDVDMVHRLLAMMITLEHSPDGWIVDLGSQWEAIFAHQDQQARISEIIAGTVKQFGLERSLKLLTIWMLQHPLDNKHILGQIVNQPGLAAPVSRAFAKHCSFVREGETDQDRGARQHLNSLLSQRYPETVALALKTAGDKVLLPKGQSVPRPATSPMDGSFSEMDMTMEDDTSPFIQAVSSSLHSRITGINKILESYLNLTDEERLSAQSLLKNLLTENETQLIETIYEHSEAVLSLMKPMEILDALAVAMYRGETKREIVVRHVKFATSLPAKYPEDKHLQSKVFRQVLFPVMLFTKSRRVTATAAWKAMLEQPVGTIPLIEGVKQIFNEPTHKDDDAAFKDKIEHIAAILARNLAKDSLSTGNAKFVLDQTASQNDMVRAHALLVVSKFLGEVGPTVQPFVLAELNKIIPRWPVYEEVEAVALKPSDISDRIYSKPTQAKTLAALQDHCLVGIRHMKLAPSIRHWVMSSDLNELDPVRSALKGVYSLVNSSALAPSTARSILHSIFGKLRERSLVFLADVWTDERQSAETRLSAATHAHGYLAACGDDHGKAKTDFQCMIPSIMVLLVDESKILREAGLGLIKQLHSSIGDVIEDIFAVDDLYGPETANVKLLQIKESRSYLDILLKEASGIAVDKDYLITLHGRMLNPATAENKKAASIRRALVASFTSHIVAWKLNGPRIKLLDSLSLIHEVTKLDGLSPILVELNDASSKEITCLKRLSLIKSQAYLVILANVIDKVAAKQFSKGNNIELFKTCLGLIRRESADSAGQLFDIIREVILKRMTEEVFTLLSLDQQEEIVMTVIDGLAAFSDSSRKTCKALLRSMPLTGDGLVNVMQKLTQPIEESNESSRNKRSKVDNANSATTFSITALMDFLESRNVSELPVDSRLLTLGLDILSLILDHSKNIDAACVDFVEQSLLTLMTHVIDQIQDRKQLQTEALGVEVLVKLIRNSSNPRTSQMALLFIGSLARLVPDAVLHNVMPIFTYVGSSDFQRDDAYSFSVVERTIENTVPVIVKSMRGKASNDLDLFIEARPLLRIFTDMAQRLPKHRVMPFYVHLIGCMGISEFLAPVAMLLAISGKRLRVDSDASRLAKSLLNRPDVDIRIGVSFLELRICLETI